MCLLAVSTFYYIQVVSILGIDGNSMTSIVLAQALDQQSQSDPVPHDTVGLPHPYAIAGSPAVES